MAKTDGLAKSFREQVEDYAAKFKQTKLFQGEKKEYTPMPDTIDLPTERSNTLVQFTVEEKLKYFEDVQSEYINGVLAQEATNATGTAKAELVVNGVSWGVFSSLELLRVKSLLESGNIAQMYNAIPVRTEDETWAAHTQEQYGDRKIFQNEKKSGEKKTTEKESYILPDPNVVNLRDTSKYTPQIGQRTTILKVGDFGHQKFSGEWSLRQKADLMRRKTILISAVTEALKKANDAEVVASELKANKIFDFLHRG